MSRRALALIALLLIGAPFVAPLLSSAVCGAGFSVPNTIAAQPAGNVNASLLDANWTALRDAANNREITAGALASRPVSGTCGRYYLATDTNGGTFYYDNGTTWVQLAAAVTASSGPFASRGLVAGTSSLTVVNASATQVSLRSPSDGSVIVRAATATLSNDVISTVTGVNGRDQAAQFSASSFIHFYYIWNGSTLGTLSSACAPSDANGSCSSSFGPTLPTGYTHWTYIGPWRYGASSTLVPAHLRGSMLYYLPAAIILGSGVATVETAITISTTVATNALSYGVNWDGFSGEFGGTEYHPEFRVISGATWWKPGHTDVASPGASYTMHSIPYTGSLFYFWNNAPGAAAGLNMAMAWVRVPNGGD